ncbi:MAG TPA: 50S ribosomal protein L11 methyltransferase [Cyclobacteriaceae bacterium]|nr:50S ribosomal protein L11 methyltransferase [Cyclobacteriaceae bacterium]
MEYLEFKIKCKPEFTDIIIAELAEIGFESFLETDFGLEAFMPKDIFERDAFRNIIDKYAKAADISVMEGTMPKINWNEEWERHYDPIAIGKDIYVRASFHPPRADTAYEIIINPKMSFGTGHHATTHLMLAFQLTIPHQGKRVIDIGSGTGILAIMAHKLGAGEIKALDIDNWCVANGNENFALNGVPGLQMELGTLDEVKPEGRFDIVLANINKNVLLEEMSRYASILNNNGSLLLSGFYEHDIEDISSAAGDQGLHLKERKTRGEWAALLLVKPDD